MNKKLWISSILLMFLFVSNVNAQKKTGTKSTSKQKGKSTKTTKYHSGVRPTNHTQNFSSPIRFGNWDVYGEDYDGTYSRRRMSYNFNNNGRIYVEESETMSNSSAEGSYSIEGSTIYINWNSGGRSTMRILNENTISLGSALKAVYSGY
jgi:hypothetical protein